jgi:hypothetical protein
MDSELTKFKRFVAAVYLIVVVEAVCIGEMGRRSVTPHSSILAVRQYASLTHLVLN